MFEHVEAMRLDFREWREPGGSARWTRIEIENLLERYHTHARAGAHHPTWKHTFHLHTHIHTHTQIVGRTYAEQPRYVVSQRHNKTSRHWTLHVMVDDGQTNGYLQFICICYLHFNEDIIINWRDILYAMRCGTHECVYNCLAT